MSRYIDIDKQIYCGIDGDYERYNIDPSAPSIDIVRCKECKYWHNKLCATWSQFRTIETKADDFCSYGEREGE